jgi:TrmH family RNA methyltransferase
MALSKSRHHLIARLLDPRRRPREDCFVVEGIRGVREVLDGRLQPSIRFSVTSPRIRETEMGRALLEELGARGVPTESVSDRELEGLSDTERTQGVLLVVREPSSSLKGPDDPAFRRLLLLDGVQDPGNAGTLVRAAYAFGLDGVVALEGTVDLYNPKVVRASAGALVNIPVFRQSWEEARVWLEGRGVALIVADPEGEDVRGFQPPPTWALAIGNEGAGPRTELLERARTVLAIRMARSVDSLNAGVAGAILLFALSPIPQERTEG